MKKLILMILCLMILSGCTKKEEKVENRTYFDYFDTVITIRGYDQKNFAKTAEELEKMIAYYNDLFDIYHPGKENHNLYDLNHAEGKDVELNEDLITFLNYCKEIYKLTNGKVNVLSGRLTAIWKKHIADPSLGVPDQSELEKAMEHMDIGSLVCSKNACRITDPEAMIDVGAIAKGYTGEMLRRWLVDNDYHGFALDMGGNLVLIGPREKNWTLGIKDPFDTEKLFLKLELNEGCLVTSGNYERFFEYNGKRYHHIIDTETGFPSDRFVSVSIICTDSGLSDALSTGLFCMDIEEGKKLIDSLDNAEAIWIFADGSSEFSSGLNH